MLLLAVVLVVVAPSCSAQALGNPASGASDKYHGIVDKVLGHLCDRSEGVASVPAAGEA